MLDYRILTPILWLNLGPKYRITKDWLRDGPSREVVIRGIHYSVPVEPGVAEAIRDFIQRDDGSVEWGLACLLSRGVLLGSRTIRGRIDTPGWHMRPLQIEALKALGAGDVDALRATLLDNIRPNAFPIPDIDGRGMDCRRVAMQALAYLLRMGTERFSRDELVEIVTTSRVASTANDLWFVLDAVSPQLNSVIVEQLLATREPIQMDIWRSTHAWYAQRGIESPPLVEILCDAVENQRQPFVYAVLEALTTHHSDELSALPLRRLETVIRATVQVDDVHLSARTYEAMGSRAVNTIVATLRAHASSSFATQHVAFDWVRRTLPDATLQGRWISTLLPWAWDILKRPGGGGARWREMFEFVSANTPPETLADLAYNDLRSGVVDLARATDDVAELWPRALVGMTDKAGRDTLLRSLLHRVPAAVVPIIIEVMCSDAHGRNSLETAFTLIASVSTINAVSRFAGEHDPEMVERVLFEIAFNDKGNLQVEAIQRLGEVGSVNAAARLRTLADEARGRGAAATRREAARAASRIQERLSLGGGGLAIAEDHGGALALSEVDGGAVAIAPGDET